MDPDGSHETRGGLLLSVPRGVAAPVEIERKI
jgi:hypothetical protein